MKTIKSQSPEGYWSRRGLQVHDRVVIDHAGSDVLLVEFQNGPNVECGENGVQPSIVAEVLSQHVQELAMARPGDMLRVLAFQHLRNAAELLNIAETQS